MERLHRERLDREEEKAVSVTKHPHSGGKAMKMAMDKGAVARGRKSATKSIPPKAPGTGFDPTTTVACTPKVTLVLEMHHRGS